jgi:hypothetical protein
MKWEAYSLSLARHHVHQENLAEYQSGPPLHSTLDNLPTSKYVNIPLPNFQLDGQAKSLSTYDRDPQLSQRH